MTRVLTLERPRNSAARIANIMVRAATQNPNVSCAIAWHGAFNLSDSENDAEVAELLLKLQKELKSAENSLAAADVSAHLYMDAANAFRKTLSLSNLAQPWSNIVQGVAEHHVIAFRWAAHTLPDENHQVDTADLVELKQLLADFEAALTEAVLPPVLHSYLSDQLGAMKAAIAAVVVTGSSGIKAAVRKAVADVHFTEDELKAEAADTKPERVDEVRAKFGRLFKKSAEVAGDLEKLVKGSKLISGGYDWLALHWNNTPSV